MISLNDLISRFNPDFRLKSSKIELDRQIAQAKIEQKERHHQELLEFQRQKSKMQDLQAREHNLALIEREKISGQNALALSVQEFIFRHLESNNQLLNQHYNSVLDRKRDWDNNIANTRRSLFEIEVDTIRQLALNKQKHQQQMEIMAFEHNLKSEEREQIFNFSIIEHKLKQKQELERLILEYNLKFLQAELNNLIQDKRVTYDGLNSILMRLIEQVVGLTEQVNSEDVQRFVDDALQQAYG